MRKILFLIFLAFILSPLSVIADTPVAPDSNICLEFFNSETKVHLQDATIFWELKGEYPSSGYSDELESPIIHPFSIGNEEEVGPYKIEIYASKEGYYDGEIWRFDNTFKERNEKCLGNHTFYLKPKCGDGACKEEDNETYENCPLDCFKCDYDGVCELKEDKERCDDCIAKPRVPREEDRGDKEILAIAIGLIIAIALTILVAYLGIKYMRTSKE